MTKPTDEELKRLSESAYLARAAEGDDPFTSQCGAAAKRAIYDAGHAIGKADGKSEGWRECIEALRAAHDTHADHAADFLERLAKERGLL